MIRYTVEIRGFDAQNEAQQLQVALNPVAQAVLVPAAESRGFDPIIMLMVTDTGQRSVDILSRVYQEWRLRKRVALLSPPAVTIILPDMRIDLADQEPEALKPLSSK